MKGIRCLSLLALVASAALVACGGGTSFGTPTADDLARNANSPAVAVSGTGRGQLAFQAENEKIIGAVPEIVTVPYAIASGLGDPGSVSGSDRYLLARSPRVAMDAAGRSLVMWHRQDRDQQTGSIIATNIVVGGDVGGAVVLDSVTGEGIEFSSRHLVMDAAGNALAVWIRNGAVYAAQKPTIGNRWSFATLVGEAEAGRTVTHAQLAMNRSGQGLLAYNSADRFNNVRLLTRSISFAFARPPIPPATDADQAFFANSDFERGNTLGTPQRLDDSDAVLRSAFATGEASFAVARDGLGNGLVVWQEQSGAVHARRYLANSGWTADRALLCAAGCGTIGPLVALDDRGNGFATYSFGTSERIELRALPFRDGIWLPDHALNLVDSVDRPDLAAESAFESALAVAPSGDATVFMALGRQNVSTAPAYRRFIEDRFDAALPGSGWQPPRLVDSPRSDIGPLTPVVAMESRHSALAAWMLPRASGTQASVQHFIWAPPVTAFSAAAFGLEVRFDARASLSRSTGSGVADFSWDFEGDGVFDLSVGSAQNTHAYARAGTYTVRLRVTDTEGISAETTQQISVTGTPGTHRLTLAKTGSGSGAVSSTPAGIACGADCFEDYAPTTAVTLNATPAAGSVFLAWSGCDTADGAQCTVTMHSLRTVSASFRSLAARLSLTVERNGAGSGSVMSNPAGIACGTDCSEDYLEGASVTLTATPDQGSTFALWSSGCDSQNGNQCTVLVDRARSVAAGFALNPNYSNLTLTKTGAGAAAARVRSDFQGIDCGTACSARFLIGGEIILTPDAGSPPVESWSGCDSVSGSQCRVNITGERSVSVSFAAGGPFLLSLDLTGADDSRVDSSPAGIDCTTASGGDCTETYAAGTSITLRATPASAFLAWTGCDQVADVNFCQVTMNANRSVSARFSPPRLFVQMSGSGRVTGPGIDCGSTTSNCDEVFDTPITVTLVATPDAGSTFGGWIDCDAPNGNLCEMRVNVHSDNVGAVFSSPP